ncbi:MAG TPA: hypothetical protein VN541_07040 [Tepidisphaeraceae bacterium]|nr:hypothetical protein [Tepidisphaeraceae bacterium]
MRKLLHMAWVLPGFVALAAGCQSTNVGVAAKNGSLSTYQSNVGSLNTPDFALGDVVALDPQTHKAWKAGGVQVDPMDESISQPVAEATEPFASNFDLSFSQNLSPVMRNEVGESVRGQTTLHVENFFTRSIKNPAAFASGSQQLAKVINKLHAEHPDSKFFLVSAVTPADKVYLTFAGNSNTQHLGKYDFHVSFDQNADLEKLAKDKPAFFKLTPLTVEAHDGHNFVAVDKNFGEKLPEYSFDGAVASTW